MADEVKILIKGDNADLQRALKGSENSVKGFGAGVKKVMLGLGIAVAAVAVVKLGKLALSFGKKMLDLFAEQEKAEARIGAVLKATGEAAGFNKQQMLDMASAMQQVTVLGDEVVLGAQAIIATFKNIKGDEFERALMAAADLADVLQTDLKTASIQLGKALNDPIKGMTALTKSGVSFTDAQKEQVKALQESGDMIGAQRVILKELEAQFGGAARAAANTFGGKMIQLKNRLGDVGEKIGEALIPVLELLVPLFEKVITVLEDALPAIEEFVNAITVVMRVLGETFKVVFELWKFQWDIMLGGFTTTLDGIEKIAGDKKDGIVKKVGDIAREASEEFNREFRLDVLGEFRGVELDLGGMFFSRTRERMAKDKAEKEAREREAARTIELDPALQDLAISIREKEEAARKAKQLIVDEKNARIDERIEELSDVPTRVFATLEGMFGPGFKAGALGGKGDKGGKGTTAVLEDLAGLNRRITQAAASTTEDRIADAVKKGANDQVLAIDKVDGTIQEANRIQQKFNDALPTLIGLA